MSKHTPHLTSEELKAKPRVCPDNCIRSDFVPPGKGLVGSTGHYYPLTGVACGGVPRARSMARHMALGPPDGGDRGPWTLARVAVAKFGGGHSRNQSWLDAYRGCLSPGTASGLVVHQQPRDYNLSKRAARQWLGGVARDHAPCRLRCPCGQSRGVFRVPTKAVSHSPRTPGST